MHENIFYTIADFSFNLDGDFTTTFSDEFRECHDSGMRVLTHVNLQS